MTRLGGVLAVAGLLVFGAGIGVAGADAFCEDDWAPDRAPADVDCQQDCCEDTCKLNADTLREQGELNC